METTTQTPATTAMVPSHQFTWIYAADGINISAIVLLIGWILHKKSCNGISGRTQIIIALDNFLQFAYAAGGNSFFEESPVIYSLLISGVESAASSVLLYIMYVKYRKTIEKKYDTFWIEVIIILCLALSLVYNTMQQDPLNVLFYSSRYLGASCLLPQIYFNFRTSSKKLCVSLFALLSALATFFYFYYMLTADRKDGNGGPWSNFDQLVPAKTYSVYPECIELCFYALFFIMLVVIPKYEEVIPLSEVESDAGSSINGDKNDNGDKAEPPVVVVTRPQLDRQQSLLETPFLKKTLPSSSSLVSMNPEGTPKDRLSLASHTKPLRQNRSKPNISKILELTYLNRSKTTCSLLGMGASSAPCTPDDEGFMRFKETALQSRQRREKYRRSSLPSTPTVNTAKNTTKTDKNSSMEKISFRIGDEEDEKENEELPRKHRRTSSFERFLEAHKLSKQASKEKENLKNAVPDKSIQQSNSSQDKQTTTNISKDFEATRRNLLSVTGVSKPDVKTERSPTKFRKNSQVAEGMRKKTRRATMHQTNLQNPYGSQNNWKMLASNFVGTGPTYAHRPSIHDLPSREAARAHKPRKNRIFSVV